jgi:hypothetical protein
MQWSAFRAMRQLVAPPALVRQHVTASGRPQVDLRAQRSTWATQPRGKPPFTAAFTTCRAH